MENLASDVQPSPARLLRVRTATLTLALDGPRQRLRPFLGSALRGVLGHACQTLMCSTGVCLCQPCAVRHDCPYAYVFETPMPPACAPALRKRFGAPPRPYVVAVPGHYDGAATLDVDLTLVGRAQQLLPALLESLRHAGAAGFGVPNPVRFKVVGMRPGRAGDELMQVADPVTTLEDLRHPSDDDVRTLTIEWLTPLRLKRYGSYLTEPTRLTFRVLFDTLLSRLEALAAFHCGSDWNPDARLRALAEPVRVVGHTLRVQRLQRFSNRKGAAHPLDGLVGRVTFAGRLGPFMPHLRMGTIVHVGNGADFGLGRYRLA